MWGWSPGQKKPSVKSPCFCHLLVCWLSVGFGVCEKGKENKDTRFLMELWRPEWKKTTLHFFHVPDPTLFVRKEAGGLGCSLREEEMVTGTGIVEGEAGGMTGQNLSLKTVFSKVHGPLLALSLPKEGSMHLLKVLWAVLGPQTLSWPLGSYGPEEDWFQKRIP